jgi:hypothetical protein
MAASGKFLISYGLISHDSKSLRVDLQKHWIEFGRHLTMQGTQKVDVNGTIFAEYVKSMFLSCLAKVGSKREIERKEAAV